MGDRAIVRKDEVGFLPTLVSGVVRRREPRIALLPDCATRAAGTQ
jgi:hypothetical protein